jgi:hypothetical protein
MTEQYLLSKRACDLKAAQRFCEMLLCSGSFTVLFAFNGTEEDLSAEYIINWCTKLEHCGLAIPGSNGSADVINNALEV